MNVEATTVVCYGDSNTWGYVPGSNGDRFPRAVRWTGVAQAELGSDYQIIEEGLNGRTTVLDNPLTPYRSGRDYLIPCLESHQPLDLVIVFLGTNDLADRYSLPPLDIARAAASLTALALSSETGPMHKPPVALLIGLPKLGRLDLLQDTMATSAARAAELPRCFQLAADEVGVPLLDLSPMVSYSDVDGIHLDADGHRHVGVAIAAEARRLLSRTL